MELQSDKELREFLEALAVEQINDKKALIEMHARAPFFGYRDSAEALNKRIKDRAKLISWLNELQERRAK